MFHSRKYHTRIAQQIVVPKSNNFDSIRSEKFSAGKVIVPVFLLIMLTAVQFYGKLEGRAVKVKNIVTEAVLSEKFEAMEPAIPQMHPESLFGVGLISSQLPTALLQCRVVPQKFHQSSTSTWQEESNPPGPLLR